MSAQAAGLYRWHSGQQQRAKSDEELIFTTEKGRIDNEVCAKVLRDPLLQQYMKILLLVVVLTDIGYTSVRKLHMRCYN